MNVLMAIPLSTANPARLAIYRTKKMGSFNLDFGLNLAPVFSVACENGAVSLNPVPLPYSGFPFALYPPCWPLVGGGA